MGLKTIGFERVEKSGRYTLPSRKQSRYTLPSRKQSRYTLLLRKQNRFIEKEMAASVGGQHSCYFATAGDFDNDMDMDLYLSCTGSAANLPNRLLENDGHGNFKLVPNAGGAEGSRRGRGDVVATADFDNDGFLDLFIANGHDPTGPLVSTGPHQLFRNQGNGNHWIEIDLVGVVSNRDGIGAKVEIEIDTIKQVREQTGGMHRITQDHQRLHFGLGQHRDIDRVTVRWPSGIVQQLSNVEANQVLQITEPIKS
jgi:hypothetical protein